MLTDTDSPEDKIKNSQNRIADDPRKRYSPEFKLKVLQEALVPGASVAAVARRYDMNTNVVFRWRKEFREGGLAART
jgi:transposase